MLQYLKRRIYAPLFLMLLHVFPDQIFQVLCKSINTVKILNYISLFFCMKPKQVLFVMSSYKFFLILTKVLISLITIARIFIFFLFGHSKQIVTRLPVKCLSYCNHSTRVPIFIFKIVNKRFERSDLIFSYINNNCITLFFAIILELHYISDLKILYQ